MVGLARMVKSALGSPRAAKPLLMLIMTTVVDVMIEAAVEAEAVAMAAPEVVAGDVDILVAVAETGADTEEAVVAREAGKDLIEATGSQIEANTGATEEANIDRIETIGVANTGATGKIEVANTEAIDRIEEANIEATGKIEEANTGAKDRIEIIEITEVIDRVTSEVTVLPEETEGLVVVDGEAAVALLAADPGAAVADIENNKLPDFLQSCDAAEITVV